ncbi:recombination protein NinG [Aquimarina gracilis]|uniref:Recombination protein NinG n=1 Tax=Aquimarina gracilis TaxID=874422 RepID=A0ABU5ZVU0_9FLAO|nr:recombination protein NinG [Aquimarina gracilis]MEB3345999.1 recombination protein NinG [Aquimarina gracilis]
MDVKTIQKYRDKSVAQLREIATTHFNKFIRYRDTDSNGFGRCISSGQPLRVPSKKAQAGHFYSGGKFPELKFNEDNVHLQGLSDNYYNGANLLQYRKNLIKKIGIERVEELDRIADMSKSNRFKWDRIHLIEVIEKYKGKWKEVA